MCREREIEREEIFICLSEDIASVILVDRVMVSPRVLSPKVLVFLKG